MKLRIGIQGGIGSSNEQACFQFAEKHNWGDYEIDYLITSEKVVLALEAGSIDFGIFAWKAPSGIVEESKKAAEKVHCKVIDSLILFPDHVVLQAGEIKMNEPVKVYSHPMALKEHRAYLEEHFPQVELYPEVDTAVAAEKLSKGEYPENSFAIAPKICADWYRLEIYESNLPANKTYRTEFHLLQK